MANWFYRTREGRQQGPFASSQLLKMIREGEIDGQTEIRKDDSPWVLACQVNGLWQAAGKPGIAFKCPFCRAAIQRPPTVCSACESKVEKAVGHLVQHSRRPETAATWSASCPPPAKPKAPPLQ